MATSNLGSTVRHGRQIAIARKSTTVRDGHLFSIKGNYFTLDVLIIIQDLMMLVGVGIFNRQKNIPPNV